MTTKSNASSAPAARRARSAESFQTASECIGDIEHGMSLFAITRGQFSMIDAILAVLDQCGPAHISLWTWTVAEYEIEVLDRLRIDNRLLSGRMVIDYGARNKNAGLIRQWNDSFGPESVRYVINHAKIATIQNEEFKFLLRGSMNLNRNPRFEQFDLTEGGEDFDLVKQIEDELPVLASNCSGAEVYKATKLNDNDIQQLELFKGAKVWAK